MAKVKLQAGVDPTEVAEMLKAVGITKGQILPDGRMVVYINQRQWLCQQYPELVPIYREDRRFWKEVRKRTRNGETVAQEEIQAHAERFKEQINKIIGKDE